MQSSAMMGLRAVILLVCMAVVPLFAIFGKNVPDVVKSWLQSYVGTPAKAAAASAGATEPPVFRPGLLASNSSDAHPPALGTGAAARPADRPAFEAATSHAIAPPDVRLAASGPPRVQIAHSESETTVRPVAASPQGNSLPVAAAATNSEGKARDSSSDTGAAGFPPEYFRQAEQRLRQLGATYYLLETLGNDANQYRFLCKVALGQSPEQTFAFFATDSDPLGAMQQVVRQVEGWRTHAQQ